MNTEKEFDCPICETWDYQWGVDGCSCWWCRVCKTTNPESVNECEYCGSVHEIIEI